MLSISVCQLTKNSLYIIKNAETSSSNSLSDAGVLRATECLPEIFGATSNYNIGLIMTCTPDPDTGSCQASLATAQPIAESLGLTVDTSCAAGESTSDHCIKTTISNFAAGSADAVLLIWDENHLSDLRTEFGLRDLFQDQVDAIYTLRNYIYVSETPQNCGGLDSMSSDPVGPADPPVNAPPIVDTLPSPPAAPPAPQATPSPSPTLQIKPMLDLYYTTTFTIPDPIPTPPVVSIVQPDAVAGFVKRRRLHSRKSCRLGLFSSQGVLH
ncbi:hypothetical protein BDN70DRAFT_884401 [Pholiota conissans]|uniref:Uncharacterized protein n=1 Tax=Pholiota conissans TaxID=109636 RepID=A0A9P5YVV4_9AGAR|nr:hypothetical protein BDN70DRAFT_884401 [Pholiota conissans]